MWTEFQVKKKLNSTIFRIRPDRVHLHRMELKNGQTNRRNFTNFERNLAMMVIYLPVKFEFDWSNRFKVRVRKRKWDKQMDGQTNGRKTDKRTHGISPISKASYDGDLSPCEVI